MATRKRRWWLALGAGPVLLLAVGCTQDGPLYDEDDVVTWANTGSALAVWTNIDTPVAFAVGHSSFEDPVCPTTSDDGTTVTITGGCTDTAGKNWAGEVVIERVDGPNDLDLLLDGFGSSEGEVAGVKGTAHVREIAADVFSFDVDIVREGGITTEIDYDGTVAGNYDMPTTWNGSGTLTRSGGLPPTGTVEMRTEDAVWDGAICGGQAASGTTSIDGDGHLVVVTYDGETDCDEDQAARWSVDGQDRGLVEGITCSFVPAGWRSGPGLAVGFVLLIAAGGRRRRRSRYKHSR